MYALAIMREGAEGEVRGLRRLVFGLGAALLLAKIGYHIPHLLNLDRKKWIQLVL
jgi:hypothetical protein